MVSITMRIKVLPNRRKDFLDTVRSLIGPTLVLPGCISCRVTQDLYDPEVNYLVEEWASKKDLDNRIGSDEFRIILSLLEFSDETPEIKLCTVSKCEGMEAIERVRMPVSAP